MPHFSIIIPCYNDGNYAIDAIESCLRQSYNSFEIIFVDDGSTDNSYEIISRRYSVNPKIRIFSKDNGGLSSARNFGLLKSIGKYIILLDSDDMLMADYLLHASRYFTAESTIFQPILVMPFRYFSSVESLRFEMFKKYNPPKLGDQKFSNLFKLSLINCFPVSSAVFSRRVVDMKIFFDEALDCYEDWDFWIRLARLELYFVYADKSLNSYTLIRVRNGISSDSEKMERNRIRVFRKNFNGTLLMFFLLPFFGDFCRKTIIFAIRFLGNNNLNPSITKGML